MNSFWNCNRITHRSELPVPQGLDTPVNTNIINQSIGNVQNDLLRQIELQKLI